MPVAMDRSLTNVLAREERHVLNLRSHDCSEHAAPPELRTLAPGPAINLPVLRT